MQLGSVFKFTVNRFTLCCLSYEKCEVFSSYCSVFSVEVTVGSISFGLFTRGDSELMDLLICVTIMDFPFNLN